MCPHTRITGSFAKDVPFYQRLSFNRVVNIVGDSRHNHYYENLEVTLLVCNYAQGPTHTNELMTWLHVLRTNSGIRGL